MARHNSWKRVREDMFSHRYSIILDCGSRLMLWKEGDVFRATIDEDIKTLDALTITTAKLEALEWAGEG